jgi:hypothetical protein
MSFAMEDCRGGCGYLPRDCKCSNSNNRPTRNDLDNDKKRIEDLLKDKKDIKRYFDDKIIPI